MLFIWQLLCPLCNVDFGTSVAIAVDHRSGGQLTMTLVNCYFHNFFLFFIFSVTTLDQKTYLGPVDRRAYKSKGRPLCRLWRPFWICRQCDVAGGKWVHPSPLGWFQSWTFFNSPFRWLFKDIQGFKDWPIFDPVIKEIMRGKQNKSNKIHFW